MRIFKRYFAHFNDLYLAYRKSDNHGLTLILKNNYMYVYSIEIIFFFPIQAHPTDPTLSPLLKNKTQFKADKWKSKSAAIFLMAIKRLLLLFACIAKGNQSKH